MKKVPNQTQTVEIERTEEEVTYKVVAHPNADPGRKLSTAEINELQKLMDKTAPEFEEVVVRCNRGTGKWELYKDDQPYKSMDALVLMDVRFQNEWKDDLPAGCGSKDGYMGFAAGKLLPSSTPVTLPSSGVCRVWFNTSDGNFYKRNKYGDIEFNPRTGKYAPLQGGGYLVLKENCSSEYNTAVSVNSPVPAMKFKEKNWGINKPKHR